MTFRPLALSLLLAGTLGAGSLGAQGLTDRFKELRGPWEQKLEHGDSAEVRRAAESLLTREGAAVNPSDYNEMHALVALRGLLARACVEEGAWEDAILNLQKAKASAEENLATVQSLFAKLRQQHEQKQQEWKSALAVEEPKLQEMDALPGMTQEQYKSKVALKASVDEHRTALSHSDRAIKDMDVIQSQLKADLDTHARSAAEWQAFVDKEKAEMAEAGGAKRYVADRVAQVKGDENRPLFERLAYARRLQRLDPANREVSALVASLSGEAPPPEAKPARKSKGRRRKG